MIDNEVQLYLADLSTGDKFISESLKLEAQEILDFAEQFDPQPFHIDAEAAEGSFFGGLAASGWHTAAITMRLLVNGGLPIAGGLIGMASAIDWSLPVRPGDELHVETELLDIRVLRSRPDRGIVTAACQTMNQSGDQVQRCVNKLLVFKRPEE